MLEWKGLRAPKATTTWSTLTNSVPGSALYNFLLAKCTFYYEHASPSASRLASNAKTSCVDIGLVRSLEGKAYEVTQNEGQNTLHGGKRGFDKVGLLEPSLVLPLSTALGGLYIWRWCVVLKSTFVSIASRFPILSLYTAQTIFLTRSIAVALPHLVHGSIEHFTWNSRKRESTKSDTRTRAVDCHTLDRISSS